MGRRGPAPKPTKLKILAGNPGRHPLNHAEPQYNSDKVAPPEWLSMEARKVWDETAPELLSQGILTNADVNTLASFCVSMATVRNYERGLAKATELYQALDKVAKFGQYFGLTPSARATLKSPKAEVNEFSEWLNRKQKREPKS